MRGRLKAQVIVKESSLLIMARQKGSRSTYHGIVMRRCVYGEGGFITIFGNNGQCNVYQLVQFNHIHRKPAVKRSKSAETPLPPLSVNVVNDFTESGQRKNRGLAKADPGIFTTLGRRL